MDPGSFAWPSGASQMAYRIQTYDWSTTPLGPIADWPQSLRTAVEICLGSPIPTALLWGTDLVLLHNDAHLPAFGTKHSTALGRPAPQVLTDSWPALEPAVTQVLATGQGTSLPDLEVRLDRGGTSHTAHFVVTCSAVRDEAGQPAGVLISALEMTARLEVETALRESEERLRHIVDQATDYAIFTTDPDGIIESWSAGAEIVFGWTAEEAIGRSFTMTYTARDRAEGVPEQELLTAREQGSTPNIRWHLRQDGRQVFIYGVARARIADDGSFLGLLKIGQDVTQSILVEDRRRERQVIQREHLEAEVATATLDLRALSRRLLLVQEEERRKLALELHDEIGQMLTGLNFQLAAAQGANGAQALADAQHTVQHLTAQVRQLALDLRPEVLDHYGLLAALQWHIERFQAQTGITVHLQQQGLGQRFSTEVEIAAFRVIQEALTNVARHSGADIAFVRAHGDEDLTLVIQDSGRGFDLTQTADTTGLDGMRERVELLGGRLTIESTPGEGTTVIAELPAERQ